MTALEFAEHQSGAADHVEREPVAVPSLMSRLARRPIGLPAAYKWRARHLGGG
jgi:hypothetical protein